MNASANSFKCSKRAFSLVELLTVIIVIGILAALLMTAIPAAMKQAKVRKAQLEISGIVSAIAGYESAYSHFPVSHAAAGAADPDFTYGGTFQTPSGPVTVGTPVGGSVLTNDQDIAVLMNFANYPGTTVSTINTNYQANPQKTSFLNPTLSGDTSSPGVGTDLVYRDPWGNPYVISLDMNDDGLCEDAFYKQAGVSAGGINGLVLQPDGNYAFHGKIMVWSAGPDGKVNTSATAGQAENKDNVLSWR
jgi:prepilin-type N-terminal cleavage/methylation domain-containing protein